MPKTDDRQFKKMTETPVGPLVIRLGIPTTISMLVTSIYSMADTAFVGTLGKSASGAVGIVFGYMAILQAVAFMFGQGSGSIIAQLLGQKKTKDATRIASTGFFTALGIGLLIAGVSFFALDVLLVQLGSTPTILPHARSYCRYIVLGAPFIVGSYVMNNILRYEGLAMKAMVGLVTGAVLNIVLDPILIIGLGMGTAGAGLSTMISQMVGFFILLSMFLRGVTQSRLKITSYTKDVRDVVGIIATGVPSLIRQALGSIATILLNRQAGLYGDAAVAAMAIVNRIAMFIFSAGLGLGQGFQPVCSFNYGAGRYGRVRGGFRFTLFVTMAFMGVIAAVIFVAAAPTVGIFQEDPEVVAIGVPALRYACLVMVFQPVAVLSNMTLQSTGKAASASFLSMLRSGIYFLPLLLILENAFGIAGIQTAQPIADVLTAVTSVPFILHFFRGLPEDREW